MPYYGIIHVDCRAFGPRYIFLPCNAYGLILSTNLTILPRRTPLINKIIKRSMTQSVLFVIIETIFITTIAKVSLLYLTMLTILRKFYSDFNTICLLCLSCCLLLV